MSRILAEPDPKNLRPVVTPEGVPLRFEIASVGDRVAAFFIDLLLWGLVVGAVALLSNAFDRTDEENWVHAIVMLFTFVSRIFYFTWFESRGGGATPGKRRVGIRVMDRKGRELTADAVIVRNFMREIEIWVPLAVAFEPQSIWPDGSPAIVGMVSLVWIGMLVLMPVFNRDRLRAGDMVAGTVVVLTPRATLLADIGGREVERAAKTQTTHYAFTKAQLEVYGIYELQVLEELLRRNDAYKRDAVHAVCKRIQRRIEWTGEPVRNERFLREFYAALRIHLEGRILMGKRKKDKHSRE